MEITKSNLNYNLLRSSLVKNSVITIGFNVESNLSSLNFLDGNGSRYEDIHYDKLDFMAVCMSIFGYIRSKIEKNATEEMKSNINIIGCGINNGQFYINAMTNGAASIKKIIKNVLKFLSPASYYKYYREILKGKNVKPNKEAFYYCVDKINESLKKSVDIVLVCGKKFNDEKFTKIVDSTHEALNIKLLENKGVKRTGKVEGLEANVEYSTIKVEGVQLCVFKKYVESIIGLDVDVSNDKLLIVNEHKKYIEKIKDTSTYAKYVSSKYNKYKDDLINVSAYMAIIHLYDNPSKILKYKKADIENVKQFL
jgi:hypothetical protein